jgi:putative toxin-antitoxin system antitoxin component (TIGR02293 family)
MISAQEVASVLGGQRVLHKKIKSPFDLMDLVEKGLPKESVRTIIDFLGSTEDIYPYIPEGTYKKRGKILHRAESEKVERLARIIATALHIFQDKEQAKIYLTSTNPIFRDRTPFDLSRTELGAKQVEESLWHIYYGLPV